jgi:major type 1 subunit fimbrin (pilin)
MKSSVFFNACLIAATCFSVNNTVNAAGSTGGTITFNGKITDSTCNTVVNEGTADGVVTLRPVSVSEFKNDTEGRTAFSIGLSECTLNPDTKVGVYFEPSAAWIDPATGHLINLDSAAADTGVSLQLLNSAEMPIKAGDPTQVNDDSAYVTPDATSKDATILYFVEYYKIGAAVKAGVVQGKVTYSLMYK